MCWASLAFWALGHPSVREKSSESCRGSSLQEPQVVVDFGDLVVGAGDRLWYSLCTLGASASQFREVITRFALYIAKLLLIS